MEDYANWCEKRKHTVRVRMYGIDAFRSVVCIPPPLPLAQARPCLGTGWALNPCFLRNLWDHCFCGPRCNMGFKNILPHIATQ